MRAPSPRRATVLFWIWVCTSAPGLSQEQTVRYLADSGPLRVRDQFLLSMGFLEFEPVPADVLPKGRWQLDLVETIANDFAHSQAVEEFLNQRTEREPLTIAQLRSIDPGNGSAGVFQIDAEHYRTAFAARRGVGGGYQVGILVPVINYQGGFLDSTIESFHDAFGFGQAGRLGVAKDAFHVYVRSGERELLIDDDPSPSLGDIVLTAKRSLGHPRDNARNILSLQASLKLPTGDEQGFTSSGSADLGLELLGTRYYARTCIHGSLGVARLGRWDLLGVDAQTALSGMISVERAIGDETSVLVQTTVSQSPFSDLDLANLEAVSTQVTLGLKHAFGDSVYFFGLTENVANFDNSPDIGLHFGWTRSFGGTH